LSNTIATSDRQAGNHNQQNEKEEVARSHVLPEELELESESESELESDSESLKEWYDVTNKKNNNKRPGQWEVGSDMEDYQGI
jgi:hypothetical protein